MSKFLRAVYQGAIAAGWEPMPQTKKIGLPPESLTFRKPGGKKGVCFAKPDYQMSIDDMLAASLWSLPQGLRMVWFSDYDRMPLWPKRDTPFVELIMELHVQPPKSMGILPVAEFVEQALMGWFRFSDDRGCWVWSNPATDPEAIEKKKFRDREAQRAAQRDADMLRGR